MTRGAIKKGQTFGNNMEKNKDSSTQEKWLEILEDILSQAKDNVLTDQLINDILHTLKYG